VLASFGGFGLSDAGRRLPAVPGVTWILADPMPDLGRPDTRFARQTPYLALLAACDAVFTKPGYGIVTEATLHRTRLLYTDRGDFPEYPHLVRWMEANAPSAHVPAAALGTARGDALVREALDLLFAAEERWPGPPVDVQGSAGTSPATPRAFSGAERVADVVEGLLRGGLG
jgi:hypothetical protein